jgi:hypothetical protein
MPVDVYERARRYVAKMPAAVSGSGGHNAAFAVAMVLVKGFDLTIDAARGILNEYNGRCEPPWSAAELEHKLESASGRPDEKPRGFLIGETPSSSSDREAYTPPQDVRAPVAKPTFQNAELKNFAARWRSLADTAWLADRSPVATLGLSSTDFLAQLYQASEYVIVFTNPQSQGQAVYPRDKLPTSSPEGVWFLAQPVDGKVYPNPRSLDDDGNPKLSRRSEESVRAWRYLVLESDQADARDWIAALVQLPLAIAAIYTSGRRSVHALVRVDAPSINEWRNFAAAIKPVLVMLGADQQVIASAVRLSRLPGCLRGDRLQKLLYLNPSPQAKPIVSLPRARDVVKFWTDAAFEHLPGDSAEIVERFLQSKGIKTVNGVYQASIDLCIEALRKHASPTLFTESFSDCMRALEWFSTSDAAREMLRKMSASR